jgi:hypothetical protein
MQTEFLRDRARAQLGQKADATHAVVVSAVSDAVIPFGALVVYDDSDAFLCKVPTTKAHLDRFCRKKEAIFPKYCCAVEVHDYEFQTAPL